MNKEKLLLLTLACIQFTHIMDFMIVMPLGDQLMKVFNILPNQFSYIVSAYNISAGLCGFIAAFFIDKVDRKKAIFFVYLGFIVGTLACAFSPNYNFLLASRILTGAFGGVLGSLVLSIIGDVIPMERRASAMGTVMAGFSLAAVIGVPFGNYAAVQLSWHAPFFIIAAMAVIVAVLIHVIVPSMQSHIDTTSNIKKPFHILTNITSDNNQLRALLVMTLLMLGQFSIIPFISPYLVANVGFSQSELTYIYLFGGLCSVFTAPLIGRLADRFGKIRVFTICAILSTIPLFLITNMPQIAMPLVLIATSSFFIFVAGRTIPAMAMITGTVVPRNRGSFMSIVSSVQQVTSGLAAFMAGRIIYKGAGGHLFNYEYVGYIAIASSLLCILIARRLKPAAQQVVPLI